MYIKNAFSYNLKLFYITNGFVNNELVARFIYVSVQFYNDSQRFH